MDADTRTESYKTTFYANPAHLSAGQISEEHFWLLAELSSVHSKKALISLRDYFVMGFTRQEICEKNGISQSYLGVTIRQFIHINRIVASIVHFYK